MVFPIEILKETYEESLRQGIVAKEYALHLYDTNRIGLFMWDRSDEKYGETREKRQAFWTKIIAMKDFTEFYKIIPKEQQHEEITLEGQKFII